MNPDQMKVPPHSLEAECSVIGGIMKDPESLDRISETLEPDDFYYIHHQMIYRAALSLHQQRPPRPPEPLTLSEELKGRKTPSGETQLDYIGGASHLWAMAKDIFSAANIDHYVSIVKTFSGRRKTLQVAKAIAKKAYEPDASEEGLNQLLDYASAEIFALEQANKQYEGALKPIKPIIKDVLDNIEQKQKQSTGELLGQSTGITELDGVSSGLENGKYYVIAGRPGSGKSTLAQCIADEVACKGHLVAIFSLEMPETALVEKSISALGSVDFGKVRSPWQLDEDDWAYISSGVMKLKPSGMHIDDSAGITPAYMRSRCRKLVRDEGRPLRLIVLDYLQLMQASQKEGRRYANRNDEITAISNELMAIKKEFNCPIIVLSQLNREVDRRMSKKPVLSDLRDSGAIEQDADMVVFVHREKGDDHFHGHQEPAELLVRKNRWGQNDVDIPVWFEGRFQRFTDRVPQIDNGYGGF